MVMAYIDRNVILLVYCIVALVFSTVSLIKSTNYGLLFRIARLGVK